MKSDTTQASVVNEVTSDPSTTPSSNMLPRSLPSLDMVDIANVPRPKKRVVMMQTLQRIDQVEVIHEPHKFLQRHQSTVNLYWSVPASNIPTIRTTQAAAVPDVQVPHSYEEFRVLRTDIYGVVCCHSSPKECEFCHTVINRYLHDKEQPHAMLPLAHDDEHINKMLTMYLMRELDHVTNLLVVSQPGQPPLCPGIFNVPWLLYYFFFPAMKPHLEPGQRTGVISVAAPTERRPEGDDEGILFIIQ